MISMKRIKYILAVLLIGQGLTLSAQSYQYGVVTESVINIKITPSYASEMTTQALMGMPVHVLESAHGWLKIVTPEGYQGWTTDEGVKILSDAENLAYAKAEKVIVTDYFTLIRNQASPSAQVVSDVVWGDLLLKTGESANYYSVQTPDGRAAYIAKNQSVPFAQWLATRRPTADNIIATAKLFIGFPYVWGGTSIKGIDCSGFTKTTYYLNGVILLRDASQQARTGESVDISGGLQNLKPADLLFFGSKKDGKERVSHVGIYIGNGQFIHSSGKVHISSLVPGAAEYDQYNAKRLLKAKRILTCIDKDTAIVSVKNHPWYKK
jgi:cell wall-associated NlpC family hydrolase